MKNTKLFWGSSYDRGLDLLLFMWPDILEKFPEATLDICYGWDLFEKGYTNNAERMNWKRSVDQLMTQKGITHHGRIGKEELKRIRSSCGVWAYPTHFAEINCITALECQNDGLVPVVPNNFALKETVGSGIKVDGNIKNVETQKRYLEALFSIMGNHEKWEEESKKAREFAKNYYWDKIAADWISVFKENVSNPKVSVITITIREGFWNLMANNLSKQTYKNFEWVIIDDHKRDRSKTAEKYAKRYNLNIKYIRGDKALGKYDRKHGLARANNLSWKNAEGELLVYVQDFILIPENGVESLVDLYRHNPKALLAPVDQYFFPKKVNKDNKEDWFDGETDVIGEFSWRNVRMDYQGIRKTENPYDFEMNYAGIPRKIVEHLNGWYEFFDDGIGFDNTEFSQRALELGYEIIIDDTNVATCLDIGHHGFPLNERGWKKFSEGNYPAVRNEELDK